LRRALEQQREVTRNQAEEWLDLTADLESTLERYVGLFNEAPIAYAMFDDKGVIVNVNLAAAKMLQIQPEPVGNSFIRYIDPRDTKLFVVHQLECARTGEATTELRLAHEDRKVRLMTRCTRTIKSRGNLYYTAITDVTEERRRAQALVESEARYREIVETANEGICIVNAENEIIFTNRRLAAMIGVPTESLIGRPAACLVPEADMPDAERAFAQRDIGAAGQSMQRLRRADGTSIAAAVSTTIRRDTDGNFTGLLRMYTDATARQELTESRELLMRQLVAAQERERQRIARELHDQMGQHIVALSLGLARLAETPRQIEASALVAHLRGVADALGRDMHTLALELRPSALDHLGLTAALRGYAEELASRTALQIDVHCDGIDGLQLETAMQTGLYRIAQEALTNVVKHAGAKSVSVILERRDETLQLIVEDDGVGFAVQDPRRMPEHKLGLAGMRERASLLGGLVTIESSPSGGTTVYARIPIPISRHNDNEQTTSAVTG
jgi:PAS domain S-box-containing protein